MAYPDIYANLLGSLDATIDLSALGVFNVKFYGAKWDNVTDDAPAIQDAITAASTAGGGLVIMPGGNAKFGTMLTVPANVALVGQGRNITVLNAINAGQNGITVGGGGSVEKNAVLRDFSIVQGTVTGTVGVGLSLNLTSVVNVSNMQISGFVTGVSQIQSPDATFENVLTSYSGASAAVGWSIDGQKPTYAGNVSSVYRDCSVDFSGATGTTNIGRYVFSSVANGDCGDLNFFNFSSSKCYISLKCDFTNAQTFSDCSSDIIDRDAVHDLYTYIAILKTGGDTATLVKVEGGWFDAAQGAAGAIVGIYSDTGGILVNGAEFPPAPTSNPNPVYGIQIAGGDSVVNGCSFNGITRGIYANGGSLTATGNRFFSSPDSGSGIGIAMASVYLVNCAGAVVTGNSFRSIQTNGMAIGMYIDSTASQTVVDGNSFDAANITATQIIINNSTTSTIANNPGYNPTGSVTITPASHAWTNLSGVRVTAYVATAGTFTGTTTITPSGGSAVTVPNATIGMAYSIPPGATLTWGVGGAITTDPTFDGFGD